MQEFLTRIVVVLLVLFLGVDPTLAIGVDVNKQTNKQTNFDKSLLQAEALAARPRFSGERIIETDIPNGLQPLFNGTRPPLYGKPVGSLRKIHVRWPLRWEQVPMLQPEEGLEFGHLFHSRPRLQSPIYRTEKSNEEQGSGTTSRTPKGTPALEELESKIFAVHSTPILPTNGIMIAGARDISGQHNGDEPPSFRPTIHWSLGQVVQQHGDFSWDENAYTIVTPLKTLEAQLVNLYPNDTFILGNFRLTSATILLVPKGSDVTSIPSYVPIVQYDPKSGLRKAVDQVIEEQGGWPIRMLREGVDTGAIAYIGERDINSLDFFAALFEKFPGLSYGTHTNEERGNAFRFGIIEQALNNFLKAYSGHWFEYSTIQVKYTRSLILHNLERLEQALKLQKLNTEAMNAFDEKKVKLLSWLNIIDVDLEIREQFGKTLIVERGSIEKDLWKLRNDPGKLRAFARLQLPYLKAAEETEKLSPNVLAEHLEAFSPQELSEFMAKNQEAFLYTDIARFYLYYAIKRWIVVKTERARNEGLDELIRKALPQIRPPLRQRQGEQDYQSIFRNLESFLSTINNRLETVLEILREPALNRYLSAQGVIFTPKSPQTLEEVLRAHPDTRVIFSPPELRPTGEEQEALQFLRQIDRVPRENESLEKALQSFRAAHSLASHITWSHRRLRKDLADLRKPMKSIRSEDELVAGDELSLYEILQRDTKPIDLWTKVGLEKEYQQVFPRDEQFWQSQLSLFEIYQRLKRIKTNPSSGSALPGHDPYPMLTVAPLADVRDQIAGWLEAKGWPGMAQAVRVGISVFAAAIESFATPIPDINRLWAAAHRKSDRQFARERLPVFERATFLGIPSSPAMLLVFPHMHIAVAIALSVYLFHFIPHLLYNVRQETASPFFARAA